MRSALLIVKHKYANDSRGKYALTSPVQRYVRRMHISSFEHRYPHASRG